MRWRKLGRIYDAPPVHDKLLSHAANPLAVHRGGDIYRIFFSGRDAEKRSSVGYIDFDIARREMSDVCRGPVFTDGAAGTYFSHGVSIGCCYRASGQDYMLFMGWHVPASGHWRGEIGRLRIGPDLSLSANGDLPLLGLSEEDPISLSYPWVCERPGGGLDMWYGSTLTWDAGNGEMLHVLKRATSADGEAWERGGPAVPYRQGLAQAFSRPSVSADGEHMWFSYRSGDGTPYRIGYARRASLESWDLRLHDAGIDVSPGEWDGEMICYPFVFNHDGARYMLYNGDGFGRTGIGLAVDEN